MNHTFRTGAALVAMLGFVLLTGCADKPAKDSGKKGGHDHAHGHSHDEHGPHGGHLIEVGNEEYHLEMVEDDKADTLTFYVLDSTAKKSVPIDATELTVNMSVKGKATTFKLAAKPLEGEAAGKSSRFVTPDDALHEALDDDNVGKLQLTIGGKPYSAVVQEHDDDDHKHSHKPVDKDQDKTATPAAPAPSIAPPADPAVAPDLKPETKPTADPANPAGAPDLKLEPAGEVK